MEKDDLRKAAFLLAREELAARNIYAENRAKERDGRKQLEKSLAEIRRLKAEADRIRSAVPEAANKEYFWDIPFEPETEIREAADSIFFPNGVYSEQEDFSEFSEMILFERTCECQGSDMLSLYLSDGQDGSIALYLDRKTIKSRLTETMKAKEILCCEDEEAVSENRSGYEKALAFHYEKMISAEQMSEYEQLKRDREFLISELPGDMERLNKTWDQMERITNLSWWTNEQRFRMGQMTGSDYYEQALWRDMDLSSREIDARQKIADIEYRMEQILERQRQARNEYYGAASQEAVRSLEARTLKVMRCGKVFYSRNEIVGIIIYKGGQELYIIKHKGGITPYDIHGSFLSVNKTGKRTPAQKPLIHFIAQRYVPRIKSYSPLSLRPRGAADDVWRYWSAIRLEYELSKAASG